MKIDLNLVFTLGGVQGNLKGCSSGTRSLRPVARRFHQSCQVVQRGTIHAMGSKGVRIALASVVARGLRIGSLGVPYKLFRAGEFSVAL